MKNHPKLQEPGQNRGQNQDLFIRSANSIYHDGFRRHLVDSGYLLEVMGEGFSKMDRQEEYLDFYPQWIASSQKNNISGLESFPFRFVSLGCTQALDAFHSWCHLHNRRIRVFRGEYPYHRDCIPFDWNRDFIDDRPLEKGDAVAVSAPFSGSGSIHPQWDSLLETCGQLEIPILVDCAFFGTCAGISLDLSHPQILWASFSTTKGLSCGNYRNGICLSRQEESPLAIQTDWHHGIHLNVSLGLELMKNFGPDYLYYTYEDAYRKVCELFDLTPTPCVHLALGNSSWGEFSRDGTSYYRVGVKKAVQKAYKLIERGKPLDLEGLTGTPPGKGGGGG